MMVALPLIRSALLPSSFAHGFSTRSGGVSPAPWDSLNVGGKWGDSQDNVAENRRRLLATSGARSMHLARQVHGAAVALVEDNADPSATATREADAITTRSPGVAAAVMVADCVPILIADPRTGAVAAVHAGWRGTVAQVAVAAVTAMVRWHGSRPADLVAVVGPSIGPCCFEVGADVAQALSAQGAAGAPVVRPQPDGRIHADLWTANQAQLQQTGVSAIDIIGACTMCDPTRFFSYRRDNTHTGQHLGFIVAD